MKKAKVKVEEIRYKIIVREKTQKTSEGNFGIKHRYGYARKYRGLTTSENQKK